MRYLTFKSYLRNQLCEYMNEDTSSVYKYAEASENDIRIREAFLLYLLLFSNQELQNKIRRKYSWVDYSCEELSKLKADNIEKVLQSDKKYSSYLNIYNNYKRERLGPHKDDELKLLIHSKIRTLQEEKSISNYRIFTDLKLDPGNINSFLKNKNIDKVSLNLSKDILQYVREY